MPVTFCWHVPLPTFSDSNSLWDYSLHVLQASFQTPCLQLLFPFSLKFLDDFTFSLPPACIHFQIIIIWLRFCCGFLYSLRNKCWRLTACICEGDLIQKRCLPAESSEHGVILDCPKFGDSILHETVWRDRETKTYRYGPTCLLTMKDGFTRQRASKSSIKYQNVWKRQRHLLL